MNYSVRFPNHSIESKFEKLLLRLPNAIGDGVMKQVKNLASDPCPFGKKSFKKLKPPIQFYQFTAQYRIRIGNYRVLYDVDDRRKIVWILALRKREEKTYR